MNRASRYRLAAMSATPEGVPNHEKNGSVTSRLMASHDPDGGMR